MDLDPLQVNALGANVNTHLDTVTSTVFTIGGGQVEEVWAMLGQERVISIVCTKSTRAQNDWSEFLVHLACFLILQTHNSLSIRNQLECFCLVDQSCPFTLL